MVHLTLSLEEEIALLNKYNLDSNELLVLRCIVMLQEEKQELLFHSLMGLHSIDFRNILVSLQNKGIVLKSDKIAEKGQPFDPYSIQLNKNFVKQLYKSLRDIFFILGQIIPVFVGIKVLLGLFNFIS